MKTVTPIIISSNFNPIFSINFTLNKINSISKILTSIIPYFSLTTSYSTFSKRSPYSLTNLISSITLFLSTLIN